MNKRLPGWPLANTSCCCAFAQPKASQTCGRFSQPSGFSPQAPGGKVDGPSFERAGAVSFSEASEPLSEHGKPLARPQAIARQPKPPDRQIEFDQAHRSSSA